MNFCRNRFLFHEGFRGPYPSANLDVGSSSYAAVAKRGHVFIRQHTGPAGTSAMFMLPPCFLFDVRRDAAPATSRVRPRLPQSKLETHRLWHEDGLSVDAVAEVRCNKASTVRGYLSGERCQFWSKAHNKQWPVGRSTPLLKNSGRAICWLCFWLFLFFGRVARLAECLVRERTLSGRLRLDRSDCTLIGEKDGPFGGGA